MGNPEHTTDADATSTDNSSSVDFEKRFKDTQGAYTKSQQELKAAKAKLEALEKLTVPKVEIDEQTSEELESLKYDDPDAWRAKINQLEQEASAKHKAILEEASNAAVAQSEADRRSQIFDEFTKSHPNLNITDDVIKYDVPPRITNKLESGEIDFETYLTEVANYLESPKVIGDGNTTLGQPNLGKLGGGSTPSDTSVGKNIVENYNEMVF